MRSWLFGSGKSNSSISASATSATGGEDNNAASSSDANASSPFRGFSQSSRSGSGTGESGFMGFGSPRANDAAKIDKEISKAARNLGDGVQKIVMAAKAKHQEGSHEKWKSELLELLGAAPASSSSSSSPTKSKSSDKKEKSDIDILLSNTRGEMFALRCVENELPPNLIHCMRLLRVLELQHAADTPDGEELKPIGVKATSKVSRLLVALCVDPSVGEQIRPHLFGLLALSGASYPPSGVHVAQAASDIILAFAENCLTRQLVWFIHDRKMIVHMTDDIKELCGMSNSESSAPPVPRGLTSTDAEKAGLWAIALETVIKLINCTCRFQTTELVRDFEAADGYEVFLHAIRNSSAPHGSKIVELLPSLAGCPSGTSAEEDIDEKVATNLRVFDMQQELLLNSNPLLMDIFSDMQHPDLSEIGPLPVLAEKSIAIAVKTRTDDDSKDASSKRTYNYDIASALLGATLQLLSNHPDNYDILEDRQHILTYYILAFPCFGDEDLKNFVLKTLEFVLTGVGVTDEVTPVNACVEIFFALCQTLLKGIDAMNVPESRREEAISLLAADLDLMGGTLEKLLQFDQRVAPLMVESGIMTTSLNSLLDRVDEHSQRKYGDADSGHLPPQSTPLDSTFCTVCRVLKLLVAHQPVNFSRESSLLPETEEPTNLHTLLRRALKDLGNDAAHGAAGVFEAYMSSFASLIGLEHDMRFTLHILRDFAELTLTDENAEAHSTVLDREAVIISLIRSVLEARGLSRDAFRTCGGFDAILAVILSFEGAGARPSFSFESLAHLLQAIISLLDAAVGLKSRNPIACKSSAPLVLPPDITVDSSSSQISSGSPAAQNRNFIRQRGYYLDLAVAIAGTGVLNTDAASGILDLCLSHVDPALKSPEEADNALTIRNPDAIRLVLGVSNVLATTKTGASLSTSALETILRLSDEKDRAAFTLREISSCGMCFSLTDPDEFGPLLFQYEHPLHSQLVELLRRIATFSMSFMDFVSIIRSLVGPLLAADGTDGRVRLPVISSSIKTSMNASLPSSVGAGESNQQEEEFCKRLELLCEIAKSRDRCPRIRVGGESVNTIAVLMHKVKLEERLRTAAEEGRLRFLEVECIDASALSADTPPSGAPATSSTPGGTEKVWTPLLNSGFTYSLWLRHDSVPGSESSGNLYILDISSPSTLSSSSTNQDTSSYLAMWYDLQNQRFNVISSAAHKGEPTCFPVSPLFSNVWHHILITYSPSKRTMMSRKSAFSLYVNGRALEAEVKVDSVNLPPNSRLVVGAPSPALAGSGVVRGMMPVWEVGPVIMLSTVLLDLDATAIFAFGPEFPGLLWGDRPQRTSLAATGTVAFSMLAESGEAGSVASGLKRRDVQKLESAGYSVLGHTDEDTDDLSTLGLLCSIPPDCVIFAFQLASTANKLKNESPRGSRTLQSERLVNLARLNFSNENASTDAIVHGKGSAVVPMSFPASLQWSGGPALLMPLVNSAKTPRALAYTLKIVREGTRRHPPNLEAMQAGGGYRILAVLLKEKGFADKNCLDECLAFAINGFTESPKKNADTYTISDGAFADVVESAWVLSDVDAMKHLILNHQVWDLTKCGPDIPLRLLSALSVLVSQKSVHKAFNARRLHLVGIVRWALHLMLEGAELYSNGEKAMRQNQQDSVWYSESPPVSDVLVGGDPGNPFLLACKNLLRRVLTFMLTPGDLEALADAIVYTLSISSFSGNADASGKESSEPPDECVDRMLPGPAARLYLVRLIEELVVDGVNEIVSHVAPSPKKKDPSAERDNTTQQPILYHAGGVASPNQPYLSTSVTRGKVEGGGYHPKHRQAQAFLSAFAGFLTPVWFATVLEGCNEEASASAVLRLLILMLQGSASFEKAFRAAGGFAPFVISVPKFSTCPGITLSMLSDLLNVPILHLHSFPTLDPEQLCEVFDAECCEFVVKAQDFEEPSSGIFALIAECLGRNIKLLGNDNEVAKKAHETNQAVVEVISHRHGVSSSFREFCATPSFLEPLSQALCLVYNDAAFSPRRGKRRSLLSDVPRDMTPTERFVGGSDVDVGGIGMVLLLRMVIHSSITRGPRAATVFYTIFRSFPIHATPQQVEAFHLVLIEQCRSVIKEVLDKGDSISLANCLGLCSVLLDQQLSAFFAAESAIESVRLSISVLNVLTKVETEAARALGMPEYSLLCTDAAHLSNLICVAALRVSLPLDANDFGDEDLQAAVLEELNTNILSLLLVPNLDQKSSKRIPTGLASKPSQSSKLFPIWQSASLARCVEPQKYGLYPDLYESDNPQVAVTAPLLVALHRLLMGSREDVRSLVISIFVALLQHRQSILSELLVAEVPLGDQMETIDVVNRGGFRALLAAHEAATLADRNSSASASVKRKYAPFFDWFDRNQSQVQLVFDVVNEKGSKLFPGLERVTIPQELAIEKEQKLMLMRLTAQASENTILGGIERGELARRCAERTTDSHTRWKRQGFDDLAFGATKWKVLLRQLKGSSSVWEGGPRYDNSASLVLENRLSELKSRDGLTRRLPSDGDNLELVKRWKLDLSEGYERQRRRLLPNYEFHGLYNLDEKAEHLEAPADDSTVSTGEGDGSASSPEFQMEATAALLKDLNLKRAIRTEEEDDDDDEDDVEAEAEGDDEFTVETTTTISSTADGASLATPDADRIDNAPDGKEESEVDKSEEEENQEEKEKENDDSSSYGVITGLLQAGDWPEKSYNVQRCTGLEVTKALLLWCKDAMYVIDGFEQTGGAGMDGKITRVEREQASYNISLRRKDFKVSEEKSAEEMAASSHEKGATAPVKSNNKELARSRSSVPASANDVLYQHRSQRIPFSELFSVYRRRYQLQQSALEFYDVNKNGTLIAFSNHKEREEVLSKVLQAKLPNSIFSSSYGTFISYSKFMNNLKAKIVSQWVNGKMTNFDFLMHLNSFAGRSFNDLTQYPVFPWIIADYDSEEIDLNDPKTYRDLSKPMGAIGEQRANQFRERYEALASTCFSDDDPPPFHYGTHYSSAAYVLYYLMRLEPFSRLALALQGGRFDVADRLFHDVGRSWKSASAENLQDVRELIPEFFYLPDFFSNTNHFDFGETQRGKTVHDVSLPKWAKGDPQKFVRINRQALESEYVSKNLHHWIDLIFGYKQRGQEAVDALNVFVHVTYEGEVDLETMTDPIQRASIIAQIQNFGQTPSRLEKKPFPLRQVQVALKDKAIDFGSLQSLAPLTPPFCIVGAPHRVSVQSTTTDTCKLGLAGQSDTSVGDMCLIKGQLIGVGRMCSLIIPAKKFYRFGYVNNGVSVHAAVVSSRYREVNKVISFHDALHRAPVTAAKASLNGDWLVTGSADSTLRVWKYNGYTLSLHKTLCGHDGSHIKSIDVSTEFGVIVSGCGRGKVLLWDLRSLTFVRALKHGVTDEACVSVSINHTNGNVATLVGSQLTLFDINGNLIASCDPNASNKPTCAVATDCPEWMENGIVLVTGHFSGEVCFWGVDNSRKEFVMRHLLKENPHTSAVTALRVTCSLESPDIRTNVVRAFGAERQDTLLVGDSSGKMSVCKTTELVSYSATELADVVTELESSNTTINQEEAKS